MMPLLEDYVMSVLGASGHPSLETDFVSWTTKKRDRKIEIVIIWEINYWIAPGQTKTLKKVELKNYFPDTEEGELFLSEFEDGVALDFLTAFQGYVNDLDNLDSLYL